MAITASEQRAISKAIGLDLAAQVERVRFGLYRVPSTSEADVTHTVTVEDGGRYACTCKASNRPACVHRAAVYLAKLQATGAKVVGVKPATRRPAPASAPAAALEPIRQSVATIRIGGVEFVAEGRNVLDAIAHAAEAAHAAQQQAQAA